MCGYSRDVADRREGRFQGGARALPSPEATTQRVRIFESKPGGPTQKGWGFGRRSCAATVYFVAPLGFWVIEAVAFLVVQLAAVQHVAPAAIR